MDAIRNMIGKKGMRKVGYPPPADATKEEREAALEAFKKRNSSPEKAMAAEAASEFDGYQPGWVARFIMPRKWVDIFSMCFIFAFAIILVVAWIMLLNLSIDAHKEMAIATDHQRTCDHVYLEGDSSRAALHNFLTTNDTGTRKTRAQLINTIMQLFLTVYIGTFIVAVIVVWHAAGPTYLYKTQEATNNLRCLVFILVSLGIIIWLTRAAGVSTIEDDANQLTRFYFALPAEFSASGKVDRIMMNDMSVHKWTAVVVLTCFAAAYKMSNGYWLLKYMFYICATAAACLAATAYYSPRVFNGGVADYQAVREEFVQAYIALTDNERALICKEARLNMRLKTGRVSDKTCDKDNIFEYVEHQKGKEFMVSPEKEGSMSSQMQQVRKVLSKARKTNDGVTTMGSLVKSVMFLSAILLIIVALQLGDMFPGGLGMVDHMVFHFSGTMWVSIFLFVAILLAVSVAWVKNALMSTDSDIPDKKEN